MKIGRASASVLLLGIVTLPFFRCGKTDTKSTSDSGADTQVASSGGIAGGEGGAAGQDAESAGLGGVVDAARGGASSGGKTGPGGIGLGGSGGIDLATPGAGGASDASQAGSPSGGRTGSDGAGSGGTGGAGVDAGGGNSGAGGVVCPPTVPADGSSCPSGLACSWGDHPLFSCRTLATCYSSKWTVSEPPETCTLDPACAPKPSDLGACPSADYLLCIYPDGSQCTCTDCCSLQRCQSSCVSPGRDYVYACGGPPRLSSSDCPSVIPNRGTTCNFGSGTVCYNTCDLKVTCDAGIWNWNTHPCSTSSGGVCAAPDTPIATPTGERSIADIKVGDLVYSIDGDGVHAVPVVRVRRQRVEDHRVVRITTTDGRVLEISAPHPTADGRRFGDLARQGLLDGHKLESVEVVRYGHPYTYDILPGSDTGFYFAGGMLIGSTIPRGQPESAHETETAAASANPSQSP